MGKNMGAYSVIYDEMDYSVGTPQTPVSITRSGSADEALISCLNKVGAVDLRIMSESSGLTVEELVRVLRGKAIYQDPARILRSSAHVLIGRRWKAGMPRQFTSPVISPKSLK